MTPSTASRQPAGRAYYQIPGVRGRRFKREDLDKLLEQGELPSKDGGAGR